MSASNRKSLNQPSNPVTNSPSAPVANAIPSKAFSLFRSEDYSAALDAVKHLGAEHSVLNFRGVCLLRQRKAEAAARLFRSVVLKTGCTWSQAGVSDVYKLNLATALLLMGHPMGCLELLAEVNDKTQPQLVTLKAAIQTWEASLTWWQKVNWKFGGVEPVVNPPIVNQPGSLESRQVKQDQLEQGQQILSAGLTTVVSSSSLNTSSVTVL